MDDRIQKIERTVKRAMAAVTAPELRIGHDFDHVDRVRGWALRIACGEGFPDLALVEAAALLHDIGLTRVTADQRDRHAQVGAEIAGEVLHAHQLFDEARIADIMDAIRCHSQPAGGGPLGDILRDADKLDALGAIGLMRAFTSKHSKPPYPSGDAKGATWALPMSSFEAGFAEGKGIGETLIDQVNFQISFYGDLHTETARQLGAPLVAYMRTYVEHLDAEVKATHTSRPASPATEPLIAEMAGSPSSAPFHRTLRRQRLRANCLVRPGSHRRRPMHQREVGRYWNENAEVWTRLARAGYDTYRDCLNTPAFLAMLPDIEGLIGLDIGCGEGHNTRQIARCGACMTAVDVAEVFIGHARALEATNPLGIAYHIASALDLPFGDNAFDFATATMSLMDVPEPERALAEAFRVLKPGGFLQFSITHPCFDTPHRRNLRDDDGNTYAIEVGGYFQNLDGEVTEWLFSSAPEEVRAGLPTFKTPRFTRTLSQWLNALIDLGFVLERIEEPRPSDETVRACPNIQDAQVVAYFLHLRARKPSAPTPTR